MCKFSRLIAIFSRDALYALLFWMGQLARVSPIFILVACESLPDMTGKPYWADITLSAAGMGLIQGEWTPSERLLAIQRAKADVYVQLESQVMRVPVGTGSVFDLAEKDDVLKGKIFRYVRGAKIIRTEGKSNGIEVVAQLSLREDFKATLGMAKRKPLHPPGDRNTNDFSR